MFVPREACGRVGGFRTMVAEDLGLREARDRGRLSLA
jgi:hypothetical protein